MYLCYNWLSEFTPYDGSPEELAHCLTMLGLEVEEIFDPFSHIGEIIVGYVQDCRAHPEADKLSICEVDTGEENTKTIVCGADNVKSGQKVPVAPEGSSLPSGRKVKETKIRGSLSQGMICSEHELSLGEDQSGIMLLPQDAVPGDFVVRALNLDTTVLDIDLTPNRADCLSILGFAREVAACFDLPLNYPSKPIVQDLPECFEEVEINIQNPRDCPLYQSRIFKGVQVAPSPDWMRFRLMAMGLRPINNIVDITNYVLLEYGQPLHAFDQSLLSGKQINISRACNGQKFKTLDGEDRVLSSENLLVQDEQGPVALAGIMGGADSEITSASKDVLLECAVFDPTQIRKSAKELNISTNSSYRFERGVDQVGAVHALDRCASLIQQIAGGKVLQGIAQNEPLPWQAPRIGFRPQKSAKLLGLDIDSRSCEHILQNLGCNLDSSGNEWEVLPPSYRQDLEREVDLVEEVGRMHGLDKIPTSLPRISKSLEQEKYRQEDSQAPYHFLQKVQDWARGIGLQETVNYSFVGQKELQGLNILDANNIFLYNPLTSDQNTLRPCLTPGLLQALRHNLSQGNRDLHLFEVARSFVRDVDAETGARETNKLGIVLHGLRNPGFWPWKMEKSDFLDLKGYLEHFLDSLGICSYYLQRLSEHPFFEPAIQVKFKDGEICLAGKLRPELGKHYQARNEIFLAEFDLDKIYSHYKNNTYSYESWPKFPPVHRDMTLIAASGVKYSDIVELVNNSHLDYLQECRLIDLYQPENSRDRHFTFRMTYRHFERTLTDQEVDQKHSQLGDLLINSLSVRFP